MSENKELIVVTTSINQKPYISSYGKNIYGFYDVGLHTKKQFDMFVRLVKQTDASFDFPFVSLFQGDRLELNLGSLDKRMLKIVKQNQFVEYNNALITLDKMIDVWYRGENSYVLKNAGLLKGIVEFRKNDEPLYPELFSALQAEGYILKRFEIENKW